MIASDLRSLVAVSCLLIVYLGGCAGGAGTVDGGVDGDEMDLTGGPQALPRADGAELLFSAYGPDSPNASAQNAAFSPDGEQVVFTLFMEGYNAGPAQLWITNWDGTEAHRVTPEEDQDNVNVPGGAWSGPRGEIVFASDREEADDIWAIRPDGAGMRRVTDHPAPPYWIEPVWSPDGQWIVFEADVPASTEFGQRGTIYKVRADGTELTQLTKTDGEDFDDRLPNWSPDGERILFQRRIPPSDAWDVYTMNEDGDELVNVTRAAEYFNTDNSWSPDSRWIASSSMYPADGNELALPNIVGFLVDVAAEPEPVEAVRITFSEEREDGAPSVSPDGRWVAFESHRTADEDSPADLWMIEVPAALPSERASSRW